MKKIILFLSFFITTIFYATGQFNVYHSFPDSSAYWTETTWWNVPDYLTCGNNTSDYYLKGDTVINGKTYHKLRLSGGILVNYSNCTLPTTSWYSVDSVIGYLREDTARHVYYRPKKNNRDTLLYDFNLNVGDTLPNTWNNYRYFNNVVHKIDSVRIGNRYRKEYLIVQLPDTNYVFDSIIEGIGSTSGLLETIGASVRNGGEVVTALNCFSQNHKTLYPDTTSSCQFFVLDINPVNQPHPAFSLYPNPNNGKFNLVIANAVKQSHSSVEIYNMLGEKVYSKQLTIDNSQFTIDLSNQPAGIYMYRLISETEKNVGSGKFIIQ